MMGKIRRNRKTPSQVAPNVDLQNEDSQSDDPRLNIMSYY